MLIHPRSEWRFQLVQLVNQPGIWRIQAETHLASENHPALNSQISRDKNRALERR